MNRVILITLAAFTVSAGTVAAPFLDQLTSDEFEAAGLGKLSQEELSHLERLISQYEATLDQDAPPPPPPAPAPVAEVTKKGREDLMGKEQIEVEIKDAPKRIESRLIGTFEGWYGETRFELENGQVWQQRIDDRQKYTPSENPKVTVYKSFGGYRMKFEGYNQSCPVKRIK